MGTHIPPLVCSLTVHQRAKLLIVKPIMASASTSTGAAKPSNPVLRRTVTSTTVNDSESSAAVSPSDSPRQSASSTSLSSMSSVDMGASKANNEYANLVDLNGNSFTPPDHTIKDIRDAIPKHCFERSAIRGWSYILRDMACLATTFYLFNTFNTPEYVPNVAARALLWALYTIPQGLFGTGLWVIAHECGHGAFSASRKINDATGWLLHSALFVPYFSWQISHSKHHKATGHMERDMVLSHARVSSTPTKLATSFTSCRSSPRRRPFTLCPCSLASSSSAGLTTSSPTSRATTSMSASVRVAARARRTEWAEALTTSTQAALSTSRRMPSSLFSRILASP